MNEGMLSIDIKNKPEFIYILWELVPDFNV